MTNIVNYAFLVRRQAMSHGATWKIAPDTNIVFNHCVHKFWWKIGLVTDIGINMYIGTSKMGCDVVLNNLNYVIVAFQLGGLLLDMFLICKPRRVMRCISADIKFSRGVWCVIWCRWSLHVWKKEMNIDWSLTPILWSFCRILFEWMCVMAKST